MSKFDSCLLSLNLRDSVPVDALRSIAAEYEADGMAPAAAYLRAVEDQLQMAQMEEASIEKAVGDAWEAQGGVRKVPDPAPAPAPEPVAEVAPEPEPAPAAEPNPAPVEEAPAPTPQDGPMAAEGLTSYRYKGRYGWVMIGAKDTADALVQANLSLTSEKAEIGKLEVWDGAAYVAAETAPEPTPAEKPKRKPKAPALQARDKKKAEKEGDLRASMPSAPNAMEKAAEKRFDQAATEALHWLRGHGKTVDIQGLDADVALTMIDEMMGMGIGNLSQKEMDAGLAIWDRLRAAHGRLARFSSPERFADADLTNVKPPVEVATWPDTWQAAWKPQWAKFKKLAREGKVTADDVERMNQFMAHEASAPSRLSDLASEIRRRKPSEDLRASLTDMRTIEVDGQRRPIRNSIGELVAPDFAGQVEFWKNYTGPVDEKGRPVVEPKEGDARGAESSIASDIDGQVAQAVRDGTTVDKLLALIESESSDADQKALAAALRRQNLQTKIEFGNPQGRYLSGNVEQANGAYRQSDDMAFIGQEVGAVQTALHELTHAATLRALQRGGLAATQIRALHKHIKDMPSFAGFYGITDPEEFIAEAMTSPAFRQQLADTPAPGAKLSIWQKLVGIVRMALGLPAARDNMLERVMSIAPDLMAENQAKGPIADASGMRASMASAISNAANDIAQVRLPANYLVGDLFNQTGKISWWHKTIGTMDNLARRAPAFKPVYDAVQSFIGDVSRHAVSSADMAPALLPKLENVADIVGAKRKKAVSAADTKAIGAPIFEGTLTWARDANGKPVKIADLEKAAESLTTKQKAAILLQKGIIDDQQNQAWLANPLDFYDGLIAKKYAESELKAGVVWTDVELRSMFNLSRDQVKLYHEFRAAINKSLTDLTLSEMVKLGGKDAKGMLDKAIAAGTLDKGALLLRDHFRALAAADPDKADAHLDTANQIMNLADKGQDLMDRGYAPLTRFGKYTVYVEKAGEQVYFGMFESKAEASMMARKMTVENPGATVMHGTVSEEAYKLFAGVSPETIELFGSMVGLDSQADAASTEVYQAYLKLAKNNRSAMKRMIQRKGTAGFSEDAGRVLAGFIYSNARLTSGNTHLGDIDEAVQAIPKQQGELKDAAVRLRENIRNPQQGTALGGLMFAQFLGGSVASAMVNLTQPFTMTFPFLSQYGGAAKSARRIKEAIELAFKGSTGDARLDAALKWAADEGIVAPQEIHYLQNQAQGKAALQAGDGTRAGDVRAAANNAMTKFSLGWGKLFSMAEMSNRRITFIAAYKTAVEEGKPNPDKFAQDAVTQTQGVYNAGNKPTWARNHVGGLLLTFKQYSIYYLELLTRLATAGAPGSPERAAGQRAALLMVAVLFLMSGWEGLPFWKDMEDLIDGFMQRMGYNFSTERSKQAFLTEVLGEGGANFALKGVSSLPGMPIDVAGRFGMGNLLPGTGLLTKKDSYARDLGELAGPAGDLAKRAFTGTGKILGGDVASGLMEMAPVSVRNAAKGADMLATGSYQDARGYKINDTSVLEGAMKAIGFQPNSTADVQEQKGQALNMIGQARMRSMEISAHWAQGMFEKDPTMIQQARDALNDWNAKNPETPIRIKMPNILKRVKNMRMDAINRTQKTAPKALKESVRAELADTSE